MNYTDLWNDSEYLKELPCPNCKESANPTVVGDNWKCNPCGHLFREDGTKLSEGVECHCKKCAPQHDPLKGKKKGKQAELNMDDVEGKSSKKTLRRSDTRPRKRERNRE